MYPQRQAGLTLASCTRRAKAFGIEFDSREVVKPLWADDSQFWWMRFREAVEKADNQFLNDMNGKFAIITGLMNLDCEHGCTAELHPVWAMAIHLKDDPSDDVWVILARNWGTEGFCSSDQHYIDLPENRFIFRLPWRAQASSVEVSTQKTKFCMNSTAVKRPEVTFRPNDAAFVKFTLPKPEDRAVVVGELHLEWRNGQVEPVNPVSSIDAACPIAVAAAAPPAAEDRMAEVHRMLRQDPEKLKRYRERVAVAVQEREFQTTCTGIGSATPEPDEPVPPAAPPRVRAAPDAEQVAENDRRGEALCLAFDNNIPGLPGVCGKRRKR